MTCVVTPVPFQGPLERQLSAPPGDPITLYWLGQAGFVIDGAGRRLVIDPYLSDSLAEKYRGKRFSHERMMPPPVAPAGLASVDLVLCTHQHTDHMDPVTLRGIADANLGVRFVVPEALLAEAAGRTAAAPDNLIAMDAGHTVNPLPGLRISGIRAAHETLDRDDRGRHRFLGYAVTLNGTTIYHSGDCIPFLGLAAEVSSAAPDIALLPVNGRDDTRRSNGIPGNFTLDEAVELAERCRIAYLIAHHYGMFAFNTLAPERIDAVAAQTTGTRLIRADTQIAYHCVLA